SFGALVASWVARSLDEWSGRTGQTIGADGVEAGAWGLAELGRTISAPGYLEAAQWVHGDTRRPATLWHSGVGVVGTPTIRGAPPPRLGELLPTPDNPMAGTDKALALIPFTVPFNISGQPGMSLPLHWNAAGLPIGVQLVAAYGREDLLIRVAAQLEQAQPWA